VTAGSAAGARTGPRRIARLGPVPGRWLGPLLLAPLSIWLAVVFALPMGTVGLLGLQADTSIFAPLSLDLTAAHLIAVVTDGYYLGILAETLGIGVAVTLLSTLLGYPVALWLARVPGRWRSLAIAVVLIPLLTNVVVRSLGLMQLFAPDSVVLRVLSAVAGREIGLLFTPAAVVIALTQVFMPFLVMALYDTLSALDDRLDEAARSLGARPAARFFRVTLPLSLPGLRAGAGIVFLLATTSYVSATLLGGRKVWTAGMVVYEEALQILNYPKASAVALVLLLLCVACSLALGRGLGRAMPWLAGAEGPERLGGPTPMPPALADRLERAAGWAARLLLVAGLALLLFPLLLVVVNSVNDVPQATAGAWQGFTWRWYESVLVDGSGYLDAAWTSFRIAAWATAIALVLALPAAFGLVRHAGARAEPLMALYMLPLALPGIAFALGILKLLQVFVQIPPFWGLVMVHVVLLAPFALAMLRTTVLQLDRALEEAAASLGAGPVRRFALVVLPAVAPGLVAAGIVAFLISFGEVTVTAFLTTARLQTLPVRIYADVQFDVLPTVNAVSTMLIVATVVLLAALGRLLPLERVWHRRS